MNIQRTMNRWSLFIVVAASAAAAAQVALQSPADRPADVQHIKLEVEVLLTAKTLQGSATIDFVALRKLDSISLDAVRHEVSAIRETKANVPVRFENTGEKLNVDFGRPIERGEAFQLVVEYRVREPQGGLYFFGPSAGEPNVPLTCWTQGEAILNRHWFPCFDHPNERQTTEVIATVEAGNEVLSNGRLLERTKSADGKKERFHWKQAEPHVAYLVTLVVGKFAIGRDAWRDVPLLYYVPPDRAADMAGTFGRTRAMMELFSRKFGVDYPWEKYAQVVVEQFIAGGQENTSATTLTQWTIHDQRALLDSSPEGLIAHELGHQWWGDLLTCKDWAHLWLNEGFATYCEVLWDEHQNGADEKAYTLYQKSKGGRAGNCTTRPIVDRYYKHPDEMFDGRAYPKAGWVLHMLRSQLGDEQFFASVKRYAAENRHQTVETADLKRALERQTGVALERFFMQWTDRPGHPILDVATDYDPAAKTIKLTIRQIQKEDAFWFPLRIECQCDGATGPDALKPVVFDRVVRDKETIAYMPAPGRPNLVRVDPGHTLLCDLKETKSRDLWARQAALAPTVPERLRAVEHFAESKAPEDGELLVSILAGDAFHGVRSAAAEALGKFGGDKARDALLTGLDQKLPKVRTACAGALGNYAGDSKVAAELQRRFLAGDASYFVEAALLRSLGRVVESVPSIVVVEALKRPSHDDAIRQAALASLGKSKDSQALPTLLEWSGRGKPPVCRVAAIRALATQLSRGEVKDEEKRKAATAISGYIKDDGPRVRRAAVETLRDLGRHAETAESALLALADHDPDGRVREYAKSAVDKIHAQAAPSAELVKLRDELEKLRKANKTLEDRLQRIERR